MLKIRRAGELPPPGPEGLAQEVEYEARHFRSLGTEVGRLIAKSLDDLANAIRFTGARTVEEYEARLEVVEQWDRESQDELLEQWVRNLPPYT